MTARRDLSRRLEALLFNVLSEERDSIEREEGGEGGGGGRGIRGDAGESFATPIEEAST